MPQSQSQNILGATPYRNPRHAQEAAELDEHDKSLQDSDAQGDKDTDKEVKPEHNWEKRYKDLQSYTAKKINSLEDQIKDLQQSKVPRVEAPKTQEELEAFKGQNPEMFAVIQSMAQNMFQEHMSKYDQELAQMRGTLQETSAEKAKMALKQAHPDYETIMQSDEFHSWAQSQSQHVQDWVYNNPDNADLAIQALSLFKYHSGWGADKGTTNTQSQGSDLDVNVRSAKSETGAVTRDHPNYMWKESEIARMRPDEFAKWDSEITLAQRENRILFGQ